MPVLYYPKPYVFTDSRRGKEYVGPGSWNVPDEAVEQYLNRGWQRTEDSGESDVAVEDTPESDAETVYEADAKPADSGTERQSTETPPAEPDPSTEPDETEPATEPEPEPDPEPADQPDETEPVDEEESSPEQIEYNDLTVGELNEVLATRAGKFSDQRLRELIEHEKSNKNRKGALKALRSHLDSDEADANAPGE